MQKMMVLNVYPFFMHETAADPSIIRPQEMTFCLSIVLAAKKGMTMLLLLRVQA